LLAGFFRGAVAARVLMGACILGGAQTIGTVLYNSVH
jgi:hypothetical protein